MNLFFLIKILQINLHAYIYIVKYLIIKMLFSVGCYFNPTLTYTKRLIEGVF